MRLVPRRIPAAPRVVDAVTPDDADRTLMLFAAQWPGTVSDPTLLLWRQRLQSHDAAHVAEAVDRLAKTCKWWPSWSEVEEAVAAVKRASLPVYAELDAGDSRRVTRKRGVECVAEARRILREVSGRDRISLKKRWP